MKSLNVKRLAAAALTLAALCASSMWAAGTGAQAIGSSKYFRIAVVAGAEGYDLQWTEGRVVGLRALRPDGNWFDLRPQTGDGTTPRFQCPDLHETPQCYEDDELQMTVCICVRMDINSAEPGEVLGPVVNSWQFVKQPSR